MVDAFIHKFLGFSYTLHATIQHGRGERFVFLHGVASDSRTWSNVLPELKSTTDYITIDLLGFGHSPKPDWSTYSVDQHVKSLYKTISKFSPNKPVVIVGHSMGALIGVELAHNYPKNVKRLVLCSMPLYYSKHKHLHFRPDSIQAHVALYDKLLKHHEFTLKTARSVNRYLGKATSFTLDESTWVPFKRSVKNTIIKQHTYETLRELKIPIDLFYTTNDILIVRSVLKSIEQENAFIKSHEFFGRHEITKIYAKKLATFLNTLNSRIH